jgi:hypothetical protein
MNITYRGTGYTVFNERELVWLCWLLSHGQPWTVDRFAASKAA